MPEVTSVGALDYAQQYPQTQNMTNDIQGAEGYESYPAYDPAMEQPKSSGGSLLGYAAVGTLAAVVGGLVGKRIGGKSANAAKELAEAELTALKNSEAVKNYDGLKKAAEDVVKEANGKEFCWYKPSTWFSTNKVSIQTLKDKFKNFIDVDAKKVENDAKKTTDKAKDEAKKADKKD